MFLGNTTDLAARDTSQLLVLTKHYSQGVGFIYTIEIDYQDPMQACIQDVGRPDIDREFSEVTVSREKPGFAYKMQRSDA